MPILPADPKTQAHYICTYIYFYIYICHVRLWYDVLETTAVLAEPLHAHPKRASPCAAPYNNFISFKMYLRCLVQSGRQPSACWLVKTSLHSFGFLKNRTRPSQNCIRSVENFLQWEHPHSQHRGFFGFWKEDETSAERSFPETSVGLLKPSEKMSGASFLAEEKKSERCLFAYSLRNRKNIWDFALIQQAKASGAVV